MSDTHAGEVPPGFAQHVGQEIQTTSDPHASRGGRLFGISVGPGDPELMTFKAARLIGEAHVVVYPAARHGRSIARGIATAHVRPDQIELPMVFPVTVEAAANTPGYADAINAFYDSTADAIAAHLTAGRDVAVLCEGDAFFYGSFMYLYERLSSRFPVDVVPGVTSVSAAAARLGTPAVHRDETLTIVPGTLSEEALIDRLRAAGRDGAVAVLKLGRTFPKVRAALEEAGLASRAYYVERATTVAERTAPLADVDPQTVPYFSLVFVPGSATDAAAALTPPPARAAPATAPGGAAPAADAHGAGSLAVVGLGPGAAEWLTPEASAVLAATTDVVGYKTYLNRVPERAGQRRHGSDNRAEAARARSALALAAEGRRVAVVSSGDPGIFAMATAVMEAIDTGPDAWRALPVRIVPGISAMQAVAARVGAPLGHDFCVISLSDRLKPWDVIARRLRAAGEADFALALYNPASSERTWQVAEAKAILLGHRAPETPVVVARDVGGPAERVAIVSLAELDPAAVDMRTLLIIGASTTRRFDRLVGAGAAAAAVAVYTPRSYTPTGPASSPVDVAAPTGVPAPR